LSRTPSERLADIAAAIGRAHAADDRMRQAQAVGDAVGVRVAYDAICFQLFVIGEAAKALPRQLLEQEPGIAWREVKGMRDIVAHEYHRIAPEIIHRTVTTSLDPLSEAVARLQDRL
jgi:uncharacterized protein with HEPN domain